MCKNIVVSIISCWYLGIFTMINKVVSWLVRNFPKMFGWILYLGLIVISFYFSLEVLEKFNDQAMSFSQKEEIIKVHPTVIICNFENKTYWSDFNISYKINSFLGGLISIVILDWLKSNNSIVSIVEKYK